MEYAVAQKLKDSWDKKPCDHPHFEKEYYAGAFLINDSGVTRCSQINVVRQGSDSSC